jgi:hypothetical protein
VWFYKGCYVRFCAEDYKQLDFNEFSHLSNNSIAKYSADFETKALGDSNMWSVESFKDFLTTKGGELGREVSGRPKKKNGVQREPPFHTHPSQGCGQPIT